MFERGLVIKVAEMYHYQKLSQKKIAEKLGISVPTVSRILNDAVQAGHVDVRVVSKERRFAALSERMVKDFGLRGVKIVAAPPSSNPLYLKKLLGMAAGSLLQELAKPGDLIGLGPGETMLELVESLDPGHSLPGTILVPLMGGWGYGGLAYEVNKLVGSAASVLHCDFNLMPCPALVSSVDVQEILLREPLISGVTEKWEKLDAAFFSVGGAVDDGTYPQLRSEPGALRAASDAGAVGDILGRFIGDKGEITAIDVNRRIIAIPVKTLKNIPLRVGIGGGSSKVRSVRASLAAGYFNYLISDEATCKAIAKLEELQDD